MDRFGPLGARVVALSVDSKEDSQNLRELVGISYTLAYGLDVREIEEKIGVYVDEESRFIHSTGVILRPDGTVHAATYSSGLIGRLLAGDAAALIKSLVSEQT